MRINQIVVKKLFGIFDYTIPLNQEDRITILHGPNGSGKTTILKLIDGLFNSKYSVLESVPFDSFQVLFDDDVTLEVIQYVEDQNGTPRKKNAEKVAILLRQGAKITEQFIFGDTHKIISAFYQQATTALNAATLEIFRKSFPQYNLQESFDVHSDIPGKVDTPKWLKSLQDQFPVHFIETQRLLIYPSKPSKKSEALQPVISKVTEYSEELAKTIQTTLGHYASLSQSLDRTFPARLLNENPAQSTSTEQLLAKLKDLEAKRSYLQSAGLLEKGESVEFQFPSTIDDRNKEVLGVYIQDVQKKLGVFDEIAAKLELFKKIINQRFRYKEMSISQEQGFTFRTSDGQPLSPSDLSSGEQHELIFLYEFLFRVKPNSLILIDEPEISLHIAWQEQFLQDLEQIIELAQFDVIVSTHSPQIIYDRWDLTVELKGPEMNGKTAIINDEHPLPVPVA
ncbi:MAG: AAA family ATPase [Acidobacteria bacterium]|nr:AAA family ATPase [Acidobacteriota bacterium]